MAAPKKMPEQNSRKKYWVIGLSIATASLLTAFKIGVGLAACSLAVLASAFDSLMDVFVSIVNLMAVREADKPADREHLYGHGKVESLAGLFQSLLISASGIYLVVESIRRLILGSSLEHIPAAIGVMGTSLVVTFLLVFRLKRVFSETHSIIVGTETLHYTMDILTSGGVIAALLLVRWTGALVWDLGVALLIAAYILKNSLHIMKNAMDELLDRALPVEEQREIEKMILSFDPKAVGFHNLRTRKIGSRRFIDFHFEIGGERNFKKAHELTEALIRSIQARFPAADVTVHYDPAGEE